MGAAAIAALFQLIPVAESLIEKIVAGINRAKARGELTPDQEKEFEEAKQRLAAKDYNQVEPDPES